MKFVDYRKINRAAKNVGITHSTHIGPAVSIKEANRLKGILKTDTAGPELKNKAYDSLINITQHEDKNFFDKLLGSKTSYKNAERLKEYNLKNPSNKINRLSNRIINKLQKQRYDENMDKLYNDVKSLLSKQK